MSKSFRARASAPGLALLLLYFSAHVHAHQKTAGPPVVLAPGYAALEYPAPAAGTYQLPPISAASDGSYLDSLGHRGQLHDLFRGRVTIMSFIYTQCDDVNGCPLASFVMSQMARRLAGDAQIAAKLRLVSYSFDRAHDTPATLEHYAQSFRPAGIAWDFLTAPDDQTLAATLAAYQQSVQQSANHAFAHILRVFLVDSSARIRNIYSTSFLHADTLASDVKTVLLEQGELALPDGAAAGQPAAAADHADDAWLGLPPPAQMNGPQPTPAQVELGERLFFDRRLSLNRTLSCAMCHVPAQGFTVNELATAVGIEGRTVKRNAPTLLNVGFLTQLFRDARENRLEQQVWGPLLAHNEMANPSVGYVVDHVRQAPEYRGKFEAAFGAAPDMERIGQAFAAFERTLIAGGSAFDRYFFGGDAGALADPAKRGLEIFRGKGHCVACHSINTDYALFTDQKLHNTGLGFLASMAPPGGRRTSELAPGTSIEYDLGAVAASAEAPPNDLGRYEVTEDPADRWKFLTPTLRNVALTPPYMHNGSLSTLEDVVAFYDGGGVANELLDPLIKPLQLSAAERADLLAFLRSLTSPAVAHLIERARGTEIGNPKVE